MAETAVSARACRIPRCCALAIDGDYCAVHGRYTRAEGYEACTRCARRVKAGEWVERCETGVRHIAADCLKFPGDSSRTMSQRGSGA
jgi:hypothetical protein